MVCYDYSLYYIVKQSVISSLTTLSTTKDI